MANNKPSSTVFALVDCNNFYVSCERLFRPELNGLPVVVLSNNDGCVIARSDESKALGVPMGAPVFKYKDLLEKNNVHLFSTNFTLYGDISSRVMNTLRKLADEMEIYSVDEAFLIFKNTHFSVEEYCKSIVEKVHKEIGIPVTIGIGKTKTLAKLANKIARGDSDKYNRVYSFESESDADSVIKNIEIDKVWGVGRKNKTKLNELGIYSVLDFKKYDRTLIKNYLTVSGERTWLELNGVSCIEVEEAESPHTVITSRTFPKNVSEIARLEEALSSFVARACEKLRAHKNSCIHVGVYLRTNRHIEDQSQYSNYHISSSEIPLTYTGDILKLALEALSKVYKEGYSYKKLGVVLSGICPDNGDILGLFDKGDDQELSKSKVLGDLIDKINLKNGRDFIRIASSGKGGAWRMGQSKVSKRYTTNWSELLEVG